LSFSGELYREVVVAKPMLERHPLDRRLSVVVFIGILVIVAGIALVFAILAKRFHHGKRHEAESTA